MTPGGGIIREDVSVASGGTPRTDQSRAAVPAPLVRTGPGAPADWAAGYGTRTVCTAVGALAPQALSAETLTL